jgi:hypothetical protein
MVSQFYEPMDFLSFGRPRSRWWKSGMEVWIGFRWLRIKISSGLL